jgi:hypothetical protein
VEVAYLEDFVHELSRVGEVAFRRRHVVPVLVVTGQASRGERVAAALSDSTRMTVAQGPRRGNALSLVHRVFPLMKIANAPGGPVSLGRTTLINGAPLEKEAHVPLCGGEHITMGRFTFLFETPAGFLELVSGMVK